MIKITDSVSISEEELAFTASRSSGPGGQNVNKVSTRVMLYFDVIHSPSLSEEDKWLILSRLSTRVNKEGVLRVVSQLTRSQAANREAAVERFVELLRHALSIEPPRKKTRVSRAANKRRLEEKKQHSILKSQRSKRVPIED